MLTKTKELKGAALNWAVETLEICRMREAGEHVKEWWVLEKQFNPSPYSTDWLWGGPILERERIGVKVASNGKWRATTAEAIDVPGGTFAYVEATAETPLEAVSRCYVASRLGDIVDVPNQLMGE